MATITVLLFEFGFYTHVLKNHLALRGTQTSWGGGGAGWGSCGGVTL